MMLKDHEIAKLINDLRDVAIEYHATQQLREAIAAIIRPVFSSQQVRDEPVQSIPETVSDEVGVQLYEEMRDAIHPYVDAGYLPYSVIESWEIIFQHWLATKALPTPKQEPVMADDTLYNGASAGRISGGLEITLFIDSEEDCEPRKVCIGDYGIESLLRTFKFYGYALNPVQAQAAAIAEETPYVIRKAGMYYGLRSSGYVSTPLTAELYTKEFAEREQRGTDGECEAIPITECGYSAERLQGYIDRLTRMRNAMLSAAPKP